MVPWIMYISSSIQHHGYGIVDTGSWICNHGYEPVIIDYGWIWHHGYSIMNAASWLWPHGYGIMDTVPWISCHNMNNMNIASEYAMDMASLIQHHGYLIMVMASWIWYHEYKCIYLLLYIILDIYIHILMTFRCHIY